MQTLIGIMLFDVKGTVGLGNNAIPAPMGQFQLPVQGRRLEHSWCSSFSTINSTPAGLVVADYQHAHVRSHFGISYRWCKRWQPASWVSAILATQAPAQSVG